MKEPDTPVDEAARVDSLKRLGLLDTPAEERFDRITRLAKKSMNTAIALVSLVDGDRQWFKSAQGLGASETGRDISFCGHAILHEDMLVVPDATRDQRFADNPLVTGAPDIRLYAGQPIRSPDGHRIGTLCVIDSAPRELDAAERLLLQDLGALVENELRVEALGHSERDLRHRLTQAERKASLDGLTRMWNRETIMKLLDMEIERAIRADRRVGVAMIDIDHFKAVNDTYGHPIGDTVLTEVAQRLRGALRPYDSVGRYGGEEFLAVIAEPTEGSEDPLGERIRKRVAQAAIPYSRGELPVTVSVGVCIKQAQEGTDRARLIQAADRALYEAKERGRNTVVSCVTGPLPFEP